MKSVAIACAAALALLVAHPAWGASRIKDITTLNGVRENQIIGYGLVVGLQGTGDSLRNAAFTEQSLQSMLERLGINTRGGALRTRNVAAVVVTAEMPPFVGRGSRIDVTVSSLGDASSLMGGTLVMTPLTSVDGVVYAVAQGQLAVSGFAAQGRSETVTEGVPTAARISNGALVEREIAFRLSDMSELRLELRNPDFRTAAKVADAINAFTMQRYKQRLARETDLRSIRVALPPRVSTARFMAESGNLLVDPETSARVVIDARSGTIVIGQDVRVSAAAITHGALTVRVTETPQVSQPQPFSQGETTVTSQTSISTEQSDGQLNIIEGPNLRTLVRGLNQIGLKPNGIIAILQSLKSAGALHAEIVVQ